MPNKVAPEPQVAKRTALPSMQSLHQMASEAEIDSNFLPSVNTRDRNPVSSGKSKSKLNSTSSHEVDEKAQPASVEIPLPGMQAMARGMETYDDDEDSEYGELKKDHRTIKIGEESSRNKFCNNMVNTSKYSTLNFVPKCLFEQFHRVANMYFLIVSIIQVTTLLSPTSQFATLLPLIGVITVSLVREFLEDWIRHESDDVVNFSDVNVIRMSGPDSGRSKTIISGDVRVGNILLISDGQSIPADSILLSTSQPNGIGFIETSNLDGETNLKIRQALSCTNSISTPREASRLRATVVCNKPNANLHHFDGWIQIDGQVSRYPITTSNIVLRGAALRSTESAYLCVVYTGADCKQQQNMLPARSKTSNVDSMVNRIIVFVLFVIAVLCGTMAIGFSNWTSLPQQRWYLPFVASTSSLDSLNSLVTFLILFNNLVPISLYLTLEVVKFVQAKLIESDMLMYHMATKSRAFARTSSLNEDLGQIEYVFSDKTGTLTRNQMAFKRVSIGGKVYEAMRQGGNIPGKAFLEPQNLEGGRGNSAGIRDKGESVYKGHMLAVHMKGKRSNHMLIRDTLRVMTICHTVFPERVDRGGNITIKFKSVSADEEALVRGAFAYGYELVSRDSHTIGINAMGEPQKFRVLNINEFTSTRACMSIVVMTPEGDIVLYCKGSDAMVLNSLCPEQATKIDKAKAHLHFFAVHGLRTLVLAQVILQPEYYEGWNKRYQNAVEFGKGDSTRMLEALASEIESNLTLLSITAIEDSLQEGVSKTIATLADAGIKIWVLTGDKSETAVNIGRSCNLLTMNMTTFEINTDSITEIDDLLGLYCSASKRPGVYAMIVDGRAIEQITGDATRCEQFFGVCAACKVVIACRVTPRQKANMVRIVKKTVRPCPLTLAIGDGANDVEMLHEADIGIGISGNEGMQAVRASDYAIAQFRFLGRLLLVHGNWSYRRVTKVILFSFYKNIAVVLTLFYYCMYTGYSGTSLYDSWLSAGWNVFFTFFPVITFGVLDRDLEVQTLFAYPKVYSRGPNHRLFNLGIFIRWIFVAVVHSLIVFNLCILSASHETLGDITRLGTVVNGCMVLVVNATIALETRYWTKAHALAICGSLSCWLLFVIIYSSQVTAVFYGLGWIFFSDPVVWLSFLMMPSIVIAMDISRQLFMSQFIPDDVGIAREIKFEAAANVVDNEVLSHESDDKVDEVLVPLGRRSVDDLVMDAALDKMMSSFAFSYPTLESATKNLEQKEYSEDKKKKGARTGSKHRRSSRSLTRESAQPVMIINGPTVEALLYLSRQVEEDESMERDITRGSSHRSASNALRST